MKIQIPTQCPACSFKLTLVNDQLFCRNLSCDAQILKKLEHFAKTLGIKGLGPKTLEKLDLLDITEMFYLEVSDLKEALDSEKVAVKLAEEIEKAKSADLATVLAAFSIPLVGNTASTKIAGVVSHISEINEAKCKEAGLGDKVTNNLLSWLETEFQDLKGFLPFSFKSTKSEVKPSGSTVCITGKLQTVKTKSEAEKLLTAAGFKCVSSVTKTTNYLIDEEGKGSLKRQKAEEYNIPIINNLQTFLKENTQ